MKERPIRLYAHEVRGTREGRQTQIRRVIDPQPDFVTNYYNPGKHRSPYKGGSVDPVLIRCPYGVHGDRLWVRETWAEMFGPSESEIKQWRTVFRSDGEKSGVVWRPSIHMPRWASRILLEIEAVRVERLGDISDEDAKAEGIHRFSGLGVFGYDPHGTPGPMLGTTAAGAFKMLWESLNGQGSSDLNPWVWVIQFRRVQP